MPYDTLPHDTPLRDRWSRVRTRPLDSELVTYWRIWLLVAGIAAVANLLFIVLVMSRRRLRKKPFNKYLVGVAFPDVVFSGCCTVTCALHAWNGRWYGGSLHCHLQNVYVVFGFMASIWMNAVIAWQICLMARSAARMEPFKSPTSWQVLKHVMAVYTLSICTACWPLLETSPLRPNAAMGLACLPLESDVLSSVLIWTVFLPAMLVVPVLLVAYYFVRTYKLLLQHQDLENAKGLFKVFGRIFFVLLCLWAPTGLCIWVVPWNPFVAWLGGTLSHIQGFVSVILYLFKDDVKDELLKVLETVRRAGKMGGSLPAAEHTLASIGHAVTTTRFWSFTLTGSMSTSVVSGTASVVAGGLRVLRSREVVQSLRGQAIMEVRATEQTPMMVVPYLDFVAHGRVPRSDDNLQQPWQPGDVTVFVSHRWWGEGASARDWRGHVDNEKGFKFGLLCRGLQQLARRHRLNLETLKIWIDFACIDQEDPDKMKAGISSLLSYANRSQFIIIPVFPEASAVEAFAEAQHPMDLKDYGERAWCRLEAYVFLCLGEITGEAVSCCGYGLHFNCRTKDFSESLQLSGMRHDRCWGGSLEALKPLMYASAARFRRDQLPSNGLLSVESDRDVIREMEERIQNVYCHFAILTAVAKQRKTKTIVIKEKQLSCKQMALLVSELAAPRAGDKIQKLDLSGNQIRLPGFIELLRGFVLTPEGSSLQLLDLSDNQLGDSENAVDLELELLELLSSSALKLKVLKLGHNRLGRFAATLIKSFRCLHKFELDHNEIGTEGAQALAEALKEACRSTEPRPDQQRVDLACNNFTDADARILLKAAATARVTLGLWGNLLSETVFREAAVVQVSSLV